MQIKSYDPIMDLTISTPATLLAEYADIIKGADTGWVVTEKLHGAQIALIADENGGFTMSSRIRELGIDQFGNTPLLYNFFRADILYERIKPLIGNIHETISSYGLKNIHIFGEWFGEWQNEEGLSCPIQAGIEYGGLHYRVFDIGFQDHEEKWAYFPYETAVKITQDIGLEYAPVLGEYDCLFEAKDTFDVENMLTQINPIEGNYVEGIVIKPKEDIYIKDGYRVAVKIKHSTYLERRAEENYKRNRYRFKMPEFGDDAKRMFDIYMEHVTLNRFNNLLSKVGRGLHVYDYIILFQHDVNEDFKETLNNLGDPNLQVHSPLFYVICKMGGEEISRFLVREANLREIASDKRRESVKIHYNSNFISGRGDKKRGFNILYRN